MAKAASLVWFKRNLRVSDNQALLEAARQSSILVPFSSIDPASLETSWGEPRLTADLPDLGPYRAQFLLESLSCLKYKLTALGSGLHFSLRPAAATVCNLISLLPDTCSQVGLFCHLDYGGGAEEELVAVEHAFLEAAEKAGLKAVVHKYWDRTLVHPDDLPAAWNEVQSPSPQMEVNFVASKLTRAPRVMTDFRKTVEEHSRIREAEEPPRSLPLLPANIAESSAAIPTTAQELYDSEEAGRAVAALESLTGVRAGSVCPPESMFPFKGGETAAHQRLQHLISGCTESPTPSERTDASAEAPLSCFKDHRMLATGLDNSAKLSAFLNYGCITARQVHEALEAMDGTQAALEGRKWLRMHLQIRDFFQYMHVRRRLTSWTAGEGRQTLEGGGASGEEAFRRWCRGETGLPFVDASMRELAATGFMSNRSRQNVASFLTKGLHIDWRWGEAVFRCLLVDYDPASNVGNWQYVSGADFDPRGSVRVFRTVSQGMKYDERATLIRKWLPELRALPDDEAHKPWLHEGGELAYFEPLLEPASQLRKADQ